MIQGIVKDEGIECIRQAFNLFNEVPKTFEEYQDIVNCESNFLKLTNTFIDEMTITELTLEKHQASDTNKVKEQTEDQISINKDKLSSSLATLKLLASETAYEKRITFIRYVLESSQKKEILYSDITFTEEEINKRFRKLAKYFHPDRMNQHDNSNQLQDKHKNLGTELFEYIHEFRENLLANLEKSSKNEGAINFHETKGNELWKITIDYRNAAKGQWDKLKLLKREDIGDDHLEHSSMINGELAYREYRAACKVADNAKLLKKQVKLRGSMALCLYVSKRYLEAQLYALSAILLLLNKSQMVTQDLIDAKNIFDKVKGGDGTEETPRLRTEIKLDDNLDNLDNTLALVKVMDREISFLEKNAFQRSIYNDIAKISTDLIFKPDRSLTRYQASNEEILLAKKRAFRHKIAGTGTILC
jgi:hypothetical protein